MKDLRDEIASKTTVVNMHTEEFDVDCSRNSKWGNPYSHLVLTQTKALFAVATREDSIEAYEEWYETQEHLKKEIHKLKGLRLGCYCKPKACHCDFLARKADES